MHDIKLLLASSSPYRQQLLTKLGIPFQYAAPNIDESTQQDEPVQDYVQRLSYNKAKALASTYPDHWIIGSDQACLLDGVICGKSKTTENAIKQLQRSSGQKVEFFTGVCLLNAATGEYWQACDPFSVYFRSLTQQEIERYVELEQPLQCAGSFMIEGLGIHLFERLEGRDENSLIGLPLITLLDLMREAGLSPLALARDN